MFHRLLVFLFYTFLFILAYGLILSRYDLDILSPTLQPQNAAGFYDYKGVINVHSDLSTGSGSMTDIITSAQMADLDFIFVTDLNVYEKPKHFEGYHQSLMVFVDGEYSYLDSRLLNLDAVSGEHLQGPGRSQALFANLLSQKERNPEAGLFVLSHPLKPGFKWIGPYPEGLDGLEIVNLRAVWEHAWLKQPLNLLWTLFVYPFNSDLAFIRLFDFPKDELRLWDELSATQQRIGMAGTDAESKFRLTNKKFIEFPSYETLFRIVRNHVLLQTELTGNFSDDRKKIVSAIRAGQFYFSFDLVANPKGFMASLHDASGRLYPMGSKLKWTPGLTLDVTLPQKPKVNFEVIVMKDGQVFERKDVYKFSLPLKSAGVYRVVVRLIPTFPLPEGKHWIPWIFSNPFYVQ